MPFYVSEQEGKCAILQVLPPQLPKSVSLYFARIIMLGGVDLKLMWWSAI